MGLVKVEGDESLDGINAVPTSMCVIDGLDLAYRYILYSFCLIIVDFTAVPSSIIPHERFLCS